MLPISMAVGGTPFQQQYQISLWLIYKAFPCPGKVHFPLKRLVSLNMDVLRTWCCDSQIFVGLPMCFAWLIRERPAGGALLVCHTLVWDTCRNCQKSFSRRDYDRKSFLEFLVSSQRCCRGKISSWMDCNCIRCSVGWEIFWRQENTEVTVIAETLSAAKHPLQYLMATGTKVTLTPSRLNQKKPVLWLRQQLALWMVCCGQRKE